MRDGWGPGESDSEPIVSKLGRAILATGAIVGAIIVLVLMLQELAR